MGTTVVSRLAEGIVRLDGADWDYLLDVLVAVECGSDLTEELPALAGIYGAELSAVIDRIGDQLDRQAGEVE